jgi:hypothetical protein
MKRRRANEVELIGGPLDGERMRAPKRVRFIWASAGDRWALYRANPADAANHARSLSFVRIVANLGEGLTDDDRGES